MSKPRERMSVVDLARVTAAGGHLPPTSATPEPAPPSRKPVEGYEIVPINFKCTPDMARLLARLAEPKGGIRRLIAGMLREAGHEVPEYDLNPPSNRRWARGG